MNTFGGNWTENKIEILVEYAKAYLTIMNVHAGIYGWKLLYFDGFAGSGLIVKGADENRKEIIGAARRIIEIEYPRPFDEYYFVEKDENNFEALSQSTQRVFPGKTIHAVREDCNTKLLGLANFLEKPEGKGYKILAYIDPCGMQLRWDSLERLKDLSVDVWILVPTGMGVNRLLRNDGNISDAWLQKLEVFLGMDRDSIVAHFYKNQTINTLFGEEKVTSKEENAIEKSAELYQKRLKSIFKFVTKAYVLKTKSNTTLFHFLMASNNINAVKIADEIVEKYNAKT